MKIKGLIGLVVVGAVLNVSMIVNAQEKSVLIEQAVALSGIKEQIDYIPEQMKAGFQGEDFISENVYTKVEQAIDLIYAPSAIYAGVVSYLNEHFDQEKMTSAVQQLNQPISRKIIGLESQAAQVEDFSIIDQYIDELPEDELTDIRIELVNQIDDALDITGLTIKMALLSHRAAMKAVNGVFPDEEKLTDEELTKTENDFWAQAEEPIKESVLTMLLYSYRDATGDELNEYLALINNDVGQWFAQTINAAFLQSMTNATEAFGEELSVIFKEEVTFEDLTGEDELEDFEYSDEELYEESDAEFEMDDEMDIEEDMDLEEDMEAPTETE